MPSSQRLSQTISRRHADKYLRWQWPSCMFWTVHKTWIVFCSTTMYHAAMRIAVCGAACIDCMYQLLCLHVVLYLCTHTGRLYNTAFHWACTLRFYVNCVSTMIVHNYWTAAATLNLSSWISFGICRCEIRIKVFRGKGWHSAGPAVLLPARSTHASSRLARPALEASSRTLSASANACHWENY